MRRDLRRALAKLGGRHKSEFLLTTKTGKQFDKSDLSKAICERLVEIGLPKSKYTLHGLRKAIEVRLAEAGATVQQLMSVFRCGLFRGCFGARPRTALVQPRQAVTIVTPACARFADAPWCAPLSWSAFPRPVCRPPRGIGGRARARWPPPTRVPWRAWRTSRPGSAVSARPDT
jgi:hypothetical protein